MTQKFSNPTDQAAYEATYDWYLTDQKVLPENASLAASVFVNKYALHDDEGNCIEKTPPDMWKRLASAAARAEIQTNPKSDKTYTDWCYIFYNAMADFKYTPQGSGLFAVGNDYVTSSASNCFVIDGAVYGDSLEGIFDTAKQLATIYKYRGGCGTDLSHLRPKNARVKNAAKTSTGAASFMDFFSQVTATVGQHGRRGALMESIRVDHPDIFSFIEEKQDLDKQWFLTELADAGIDFNDPAYFGIASRLKSTSNANVSVKLTDKFISAVENDEDFELWYEFEDNKYPRISKMVKARDIWDKLITGATESAEPGIFNWDHLIRESVSDCYAGKRQYTLDLGNGPEVVEYDCRTVSTNPCVTGNMLVLTSHGYKRVSTLVETPWLARVNNKNYRATGFWQTGIKPVFKISLANGTTLEVTADHKLQLIDGTWERAASTLGKKLKANAVTLAVTDPGSGEFKRGWLIGSVKGDGYHTTTSKTAVCYWGESKQVLASYACSSLGREVPSIQKSVDKITVKLGSKTADISTYLELDTKRILDSVYEQSPNFIAGFVSGLFDADGSVQGTEQRGYSIRLSQSDLSTLETVQNLLHTLGISSRIYKNRRTEESKVWPDGKTYLSVPQHELVISSGQMANFNTVVGFIDPVKSAKLKAILTSVSCYDCTPSSSVVSIEPIGELPVFDCTVDDVHCFDLQGIIAHNCGELPLSHGDSCCLGSFYLYRFVKNPWTDKAFFDFDHFKEIVTIGARIQDNIKFLDIEKVPLRDNKIAAMLLMRLGLGCHGVGDTLAALGIKYDSDAAVSMVSSIYECLKNTAYATSVVLGQEKGVFPAWDWEKEKNNPFLNRLDPEVLAQIKINGRRNVAILTNAPTGTISLLSRNCSSGIEPVFKKEYKRNVKKAGSENVEQYVVYHQAVQDCKDAGGDTSVFVEANDINGKMRIKLQAAIQSHIDHSVSVTTNLPKGTTKETVSDLYLEAFRAGCKGFTVYVDGSRSGVLVSNDEPKKKVTTGLIERPKTTQVDIHKVKYKDKPWMVLVGKVDGRLCEVFGGLEDDGVSLPTKFHKAELTKKSRGHYSLTIWLSEDQEDIMRINNVGNRFPAHDIITLTRMISLALRSGVSVGDIHEQLTKATSSMYDAPAVFARILKQYVSDEELIAKEKAKGKVCPECQSELEIKRESGCLIELCTNGSCSYTNSKCN